MKNKKFNSWVVAAALLLDLDGMDSISLSDLIIQSKLSTLGDKGVTPEKTLEGVLRNKDDIFGHYTGENFYYLCNPDETKELPKVQQALEALENIEVKTTSIVELEKENLKLKAKLQTIISICNNEE